jgi:serine protease Do
MFKVSSLFAFVFVFVLGGVAIKAQTPAPKIERDVQIVVGDGGGYLGVQTTEVSKENFSKFGLKEVRGVAVEKVVENSPAKQAGLQDGDVIVRFNGEEVTSYRKLTRLIGETAPDHQAKLTVVRGGSEREVNVTMGKRPTPKLEPGDFTFNIPLAKFPEAGEQMDGIRIWRNGEPLRAGEFGIYPPTFNGDVLVWRGDKDGGNYIFSSTRQIGVSVSSLTKQLGEYFGVSDGRGVLINNVAENSPAAKAGLKAGDVIVEVEGKAIANSMELIRGIAEKKEGEVSLTIIRNRNRQTVKVTPEKMKESDFPVRTAQPGAAAMRIVPNIRMTAPVAPRVRVTAPVRVMSKPRVL